MTKNNNTYYKLEEGENKNPFIIPEGYMENLPDKVMQKIRKNNETVSPVRKIINIARPQLAFAAGFLAMALIIYSAVSLILDKEKNINGNNTNNSGFIEYASLQMDENMILEYIEYADNQDESLIDENYTDEIIDYLIKENIEYSSLLKEL